MAFYTYNIHSAGLCLVYVILIA